MTTLSVLFVKLFLMPALLSILCTPVLAQHTGHAGHAQHQDARPEDMAEPTGPALTLSDTAKKLLQLETAVVERKWVARQVRLVGKIDYDETRLKHIAAWVPGRIDRLYVNYTGISVNEKDHMVSLYSPELFSAQEELIQTARSLDRLGTSASDLIQRSSERSVKSAREKLRLLGLTQAQIRRIEESRQADEHVTIYAPMGGVVVEKHVNEGMYVNTGTKIYTIANLTHLWIYLDAYESDLPWIRYGQAVVFQAEAFPGQEFRGIVSFVQPFLDEQTRTVRVRVNVENRALKLKPGLFVTAIINTRVSATGQVVGPSYAGKYIGPMHPEIVRQKPGRCPICGMPLVRADTLPFVGSIPEHAAQPPLVIPASAPLITGTRAIVYVQQPDTSQYEGRQVVLGPRAGAYYIVKEGLREGEHVVTNGSFKIDADLQIQGKPSMMSPQGGKPGGGHAH